MAFDLLKISALFPPILSEGVPSDDKEERDVLETVFELDLERGVKKLCPSNTGDINLMQNIELLERERNLKMRSKCKYIGIFFLNKNRKRDPFFSYDLYICVAYFKTYFLRVILHCFY